MTVKFGELFSPNVDNDINGIIHKSKNVKFSCDSSSKLYNYGCKYAIDGQNTHFCSKSTNELKWFSLNFPRNSIYATYYSIQAPKTEENSQWHAPRSWNFYGRKNDEWILIDEVEDSFLNTSLHVTMRKVREEGPFSSFNLTMNGLNYGNKNIMRIYKIDIFGFIGKNVRSNCRRNVFKQRILLMICLIM